MGALVLGLYTEGDTDKRFLQPVIRRAVTKILVEHRREDRWDDLLIIPVHPFVQRHESQERKILAAATSACGYHMLIVHIDADSPFPTEARQNRFDPGFKLVKQAGEKTCQDLLPILPIQETEAWLLVDREMLIKELEINKSANELGIPPARHIESIAQPKERLNDIIKIANQFRRRPLDIKDLYEPLGEMIRLEKLALLSAYRQFISDLMSTLTELGIIPPIS